MKAIIRIVLAMALLAAIVALADRQHDGMLWVAIDDGTENGSLFVNLEGVQFDAGSDDFPLTDLNSLQGVNDNNGLQTKAITIISENALDNATREKIETVLFSSGHTGIVVFVDRNGISLMEINESN